MCIAYDFTLSLSNFVRDPCTIFEHTVPSRERSSYDVLNKAKNVFLLLAQKTKNQCNWLCRNIPKDNWENDAP